MLMDTNTSDALYSENSIVEQLQRVARSQVGQGEFHEALDAAFVLLAGASLDAMDCQAVQNMMNTIGSFARRTLVGALLLSLFDSFTPEKLDLLLYLGKAVRGDSDEERADLQARVAIALTLIYQRHEVFFTHHEAYVEMIRHFFLQKNLHSKLPTLLHAFVCQTLNDRVGKRVDNILPIIKDAIEKQQRRLGTNDDDGNPKPKGKLGFEIQEIKLGGKEGERLFDRMAEHARDIDNLRQNELDINGTSYVHLKQFPFFSHPAHWFYPFNKEVPAAREGLTRPNGKPDRMTLSIMSNSRFCSSDSYSYACMMAHLRNGRHRSMLDDLQDQLEELSDSLSEFDDDDDNEISFDNDHSAPKQGLDPFTSYCQDLHRFFHHLRRKDSSAVMPFAPDSRAFLPLLPLFDGLYTQSTDIEPSIETLLQLGDFERAIVLIDFTIEHFGADASLLYQRGYALMQTEQWHRALDAFQQRLIIDDDSETSLCMARCFEALGQWDNALPLLQAEMQRCLDSDDASTADIIEETGRCLIQLRRWDDAVQLFFRLEFMKQHLNVVRRAIAWCSIHQGKYERAVQYYNTLIDKKKATWEDYLNMGHALWLNSQREQAVEAYRNSMTKFNSAKKEQRAQFELWTDAFYEDARDFLAQHFSETECAQMVEAVTLN